MTLMGIDFRPTELITKCTEEVMYTMSIIHKPTGLTASGHGDHKFKLECELLQKLRERIEERNRNEHES